MRLAVFGASGRTGRPLLEQALAEGHEVRALVRDPARLSCSNTRGLRWCGDVLDAARVGETVSGTDAVLSVLGQTNTSPKDVQMKGTENIVAAMKEHGGSSALRGRGLGTRGTGRSSWTRLSVFCSRGCSPTCSGTRRGMRRL